MQDIVHEHVTLCTEIVRTVRASVPAQRAYPVCSGVRGRASCSIGRVRVRVPVRRGSLSPGSGECGCLERPRTRVARRTRVCSLLDCHTVIPGKYGGYDDQVWNLRHAIEKLFHSHGSIRLDGEQMMITPRQVW